RKYFGQVNPSWIESLYIPQVETCVPTTAPMISARSVLTYPVRLDGDRSAEARAAAVQEMNFRSGGPDRHRRIGPRIPPSGRSARRAPDLYARPQGRNRRGGLSGS